MILGAKHFWAVQSYAHWHTADKNVVSDALREECFAPTPLMGLIAVG